MIIPNPGPLGRWMAVYMSTNLVLWVLFALVMREDVVDFVIREHLTLFVLTTSAFSLLVTTIVDDRLKDRTNDEGEEQ